MPSFEINACNTLMMF